MKKILISMIILGFLLPSCKIKDPQKRIAGNYTFEISCLGTELDGTQTVESWGYGRNRYDAAAQAKKNAVYAVLFDGIRAGRGDGGVFCELRPLLGEVNAREKYEAYFNKFFKDGGEYLKYVSLKDERIGHKTYRDKKGATHGTKRSVIVRVLRPKLKEKLITDGILKP